LEFPFNSCIYDYANYYFEINILDYQTNAFVSNVDSYLSYSGWSYDTMSVDGKKNYVNVSHSGVPYFVNGMNVRYNSPSDKYLTRKQVYKFQVKNKYLSAGYSGYNYCSGYSSYSGWAYSPINEYIGVVWT